jgi:hypothetical protein
MKWMTFLLLAALVTTSRAVAGEVYGTIIDGDKPVAAGIKVEVTSGGKAFTAETDKFGSYRIVVKGKGKCTLTVHVKDHSPSAEVFSYDKSTRYDWILETKDGEISLRRK